MHPPQLRERAQHLHTYGVPFREIVRDLGLPPQTVGHWLHGERGRRSREKPPDPARCPRCQPVPGLPSDPSSYAYLLGLYLGDGHLVTKAKVPVLRIYCTAAWPGLVAACGDAMVRVVARKTQTVTRKGCAAVQSYSTHWPCLLPQHGPGKKHDRVIRLAEWQQPLIKANPGHFLRGLFHSDGCRVTNKVQRGKKTYFYPRYMFSNESGDIMGLCQTSLDVLGVEWRMCRRNLLSVARKEGVAVLDEHVGAKY